VKTPVAALLQTNLVIREDSEMYTPHVFMGISFARLLSGGERWFASSPIERHTHLPRVLAQGLVVYYYTDRQF